MPIHLPPISRREFFKRSLLAGAGLALAPSLLAASRRVDANSWALLADTHIAGDQAEIARGINMAGHLKCVAREVLALPKRPVGLFLLGDCAFSAGLGLKMPDFTDPTVQARRTDGELFYVLSRGRGGMQGEEKRLSEKVRWDLVHYVRTLTPTDKR